MSVSAASPSPQQSLAKPAVANTPAQVKKSMDPALAARMNTPAQSRRGANIDPQTASIGAFNNTVSAGFGNGPSMFVENVVSQKAGGPRNLNKATKTPSSS